jgi:hypothetical protein
MGDEIGFILEDDEPSPSGPLAFLDGPPRRRAAQIAQA